MPASWSFVPEVDPDQTVVRFEVRSTVAEPLPIERCLQVRVVGSPIAAYLGSTRPEACRQQGYFLPTDLVTLSGPGTTPDMREVSPQPTCR